MLSADDSEQAEGGGVMQKRKIDELISRFNRKVADMDIDREYKMELLGMITAIGIACEKELLIEPERKTGTWKRTHLDHEAMGERPSIFYCSVCNQCITYPVNFCPNCGADMRGEQDE